MKTCIMCGDQKPTSAAGHCKQCAHELTEWAESNTKRNLPVKTGSLRPRSQASLIMQHLAEVTR